MTIDEVGNIGIGVLNPQRPLDVNGDIRLTGDIIFEGYGDYQNPINQFIMIDNTGTTTPVEFNTLKAVLSLDDCYKIVFDTVIGGLTGSHTLVAGDYSSWASRIEGDKSILYTGSECPAWVGIGTELPMRKFDVRGSGRLTQGIAIGQETTVKAGLYIENYNGQTQIPYFEQLILVKNIAGDKVLELTEDGLLRTKEVKVLTDWADYVFDDDYELLPLNKLKDFIQTNYHLPNIPNAQTVEAEGISLGEMNKKLLEKIEELTLYLFQQQEEIDDLKGKVELLHETTLK